MALTPLYPVAQHPLLSDDALALEPLQLAAQTVTAESALGLLGTEYEDDAADLAKLAVVRQVNLQVDLESHRDPNIRQETKGAETWIYQGGIYLDSLAVQIVADLEEAAEADADEADFPAITSFR